MNTRLIYLLLCVFVRFLSQAQDYLSYGAGNYSGLTGVYANPAAVTGGALKLDVLLHGNDFSFNNSWLGIKRSAIAYPKLPNSWQNLTPNVPDNIFKNFVVKGKGGPYSAVVKQRIQFPSVLYQIDAHNALAFSSSVRQMVNVEGVAGQLAELFENEFDLNVLQNNVIKNQKLSVQKMVWLEYGLTYGHNFNVNDNHQLKIGITPKLMQGLESAYLIAENTEFLLSTLDSSSYFKSDFQMARSPGASVALAVTSNELTKNPNRSAFKAGLDVGVSYEWLPDGSTEKTTTSNLAQLRSNYKLKVGAALVDLGQIDFKKVQNFYDLDIDITENDVVNYLSVANKRGIDSILQTDFPANTGSQSFKMLLPTAINFQADYSVIKNFYLNLSAHLPILINNRHLKVHEYSLVSFVPRYESYWWSVALPITFDALSAKRGAPINIGINGKAGPLSVGIIDLSGLLSKSPAAINFYFSLKLSLTKLEIKRALPVND